MTKRYLMRLGKTPFEAIDGFDTLERNSIGGNNGNLIFGAASHKLFSTEGTEVEANRYVINRHMADRVNDEYDGFILPLANAFRPSFETEMLRTAEFIEKLTIPFIMLSGGVQIPASGDTAALRKMEPTIKRFARAVLNKSSALSVRGEKSAEYLRSLGFSDVEVIGCPSMTMNGPGHTVRPSTSISEGAPIAYNIETSNPFGAALIRDAEERFNAVYMPQDRATLEMLLWGTSPHPGSSPEYPLNKHHRQFADNVAEYHLDASTWIGRMSDMEFSFGARIHGNIAAVLAGTPAVVLAHDQRTLELAEYHEIPHLDAQSDRIPDTVEELFGNADFTAFNSGHTERFDKVEKYLHENGFSHIYERGQEKALEEYSEKLRETAFPNAQKSTLAGASKDVQKMMEIIQTRHAATSKSLKKSNHQHESMRKKVADLARRVHGSERSDRAGNRSTDLFKRALRRLSSGR
ncbi:polysaccharide pyruvyl transferase family protein [Brevibacterium album]|uniref:polysaccharide pyruvyl transferase family protein n=1 Tax=Brevibacterium album TaxID=417948 RepID=UPI0009FF6D53|nr:polysaccharide pyruvyl transferase family protein [Brevibacterium album]